MTPRQYKVIFVHMLFTQVQAGIVQDAHTKILLTETDVRCATKEVGSVPNGVSFAFYLLDIASLII